MKLVLLDEAQRRFEAEDLWWRDHRDAGDLFTDEFVRTLERLRASPEIGQSYRRSRGKLIRRLLMQRVHCHVYYSYDPERELIEIHSIWGAMRRRGPKL